MKNTFASSITALAVYSLVTLSPQAYSAGATLYESGTLDMGMAGAGRAALAMDASTAFTNPAGMSRLQSESLSIGAVPFYMTAEFSKDSMNSAPGGNGGNQAGLNGTAHFAYVKPFSDRIHFGLAAFTYYGNGLDPDDDWAGRFLLTEVDHLTFNLLPTVSYKFSEAVSVGFGVGLQYSYFEEKLDLLELPNRKFSLDEDDDSYQPLYNLGILIEPRTGTRIGLNYFSEVDHKFKTNDPLIRPGAGGTNEIIILEELDVELRVPQHIQASLYQEVSPDFSLTASLSWAEHSRYGIMSLAYLSEIERLDGAKQADLEWDDAWSYAAGAMLKHAQWIYTAGISFDESTTDKSSRIPGYPTDEQWRLGLGASHQYKDSLRLSLAYEYAYLGDAALDRDDPERKTVSGDYDGMDVHFLSVQLTYEF